MVCVDLSGNGGACSPTTSTRGKGRLCSQLGKRRTALRRRRFACRRRCAPRGRSRGGLVSLLIAFTCRRRRGSMAPGRSFLGLRSAKGGASANGRAPSVIALENVAGVLTCKKGADFAAICAALHGLGYRFAALAIDAAQFLPQSRPRVCLSLFIAAHRRRVGQSRPNLRSWPIGYGGAALEPSRLNLRLRLP